MGQGRLKLANFNEAAVTSAADVSIPLPDYCVEHKVQNDGPDPVHVWFGPARKVITAISLAANAIVTCSAAHGLTAACRIWLHEVAGTNLTELNYKWFTITPHATSGAAATGVGTLNTWTVAGAGWVVNEWAGATLTIGANTYTVASNTGTALTLTTDPAADTLLAWSLANAAEFWLNAAYTGVYASGGFACADAVGRMVGGEAQAFQSPGVEVRLRATAATGATVRVWSFRV